MATALIQVGSDGSFQDGDIREVRNADTFSPYERRNRFTLVVDLQPLSRNQLVEFVLPVIDAAGEPVNPRKYRVDYKALVMAGQVLIADGSGKLATLADVTDPKTECRTLLQTTTVIQQRTAVAVP